MDALACTVAGHNWVSRYIDSVSDSDKQDVVIKSSDTVFKFGRDEKLTSLKNIIIRCYLASKRCMIKTDVVESYILLLLSKTAIKKAEIKLDVLNDKARIFVKEKYLENTSPGYYSIPLNEVTLSLNIVYLPIVKLLMIKRKRK